MNNMKKVEIRQFTHAEVDAPKETFGFLKIPLEHKLIRAQGEDLEVSDGYHTFTELYDHRITLFIALCRMIEQMDEGEIERNNVWRSKEHQIGGDHMYPGWFVMGINKGKGKQISYHLPLERWEETDFAYTMDHAPDWDGHTAADVITRLKQLNF